MPQDFHIYLDLQNRKAVAALNDPAPASFNFNRADTYNLILHGLTPNIGSSLTLYDAAHISYNTMRAGITLLDAAPTGGTFVVLAGASIGGYSTSPLAYNIAKADLQTALNALTNVTAAGGLTVVTTGATNIYRILWNTPANAIALSVTHNLLSPFSIAKVSSDASVAGKIEIKLAQAPVAYTNTFSLPYPPTPVITSVRTGTATANAIQRITIPASAVGGFSFTIGSLSGKIVSVKSNTLLTDILTALNDPYTSANSTDIRFSVTNPLGGYYDIEFIGVFAAAAHDLLTITTYDQFPLDTPSATLSLTAQAVDDMLDGKASVPSVFEIVTVDAAGLETTLLNTPCTILNRDLDQTTDVQIQTVSTTTNTVYVYPDQTTDPDLQAALGKLGSRYSNAGASDTFVFTHGFNTEDVDVIVLQQTGVSPNTYRQMTDNEFAVSILNANQVQVVFGYTIPGTSTYSCTGAHSTGIVTATGSAWANGQEVVFASITGGTGLSAGQIYYVVNVSGATFQLASISGGTAINFSSDITAGAISAPSSAIGAVRVWITTLQAQPILLNHRHTTDQIDGVAPNAGLTLTQIIANLAASLPSDWPNIPANKISGTILASQIDLTSLGTALSTSSTFLTTLQTLITDPTLITNLSTALATSSTFLTTLETLCQNSEFLTTLITALTTSSSFATTFMQSIINNQTFIDGVKKAVGSMAIPGKVTLPILPLSNYVFSSATFTPATANKPPYMLPQVISSSPTSLATSTLPSPTAATVWQNNSGAALVVPGGGGIRSGTVANGGFFASDGRILYPAAQRLSTNSYFPSGYETELWRLWIDDKMLAATKTLSVSFGLNLQVLNATGNAQWVLVIEKGTADITSSGSPSPENLSGITWDKANPLVKQRIILTATPITHSFGAIIARGADISGVQQLTAQGVYYGAAYAAPAAPITANFVIRARLIEFDTENSDTAARGWVFYALTTDSLSQLGGIIA